ncbi:hypothetical protein B0T11DRAFT_126859 [Plectosphaerella cucumerina]|uniref:Uncharacterized protein n=1 Tax=Plectosphaerella cucumerina TaxID=40658 RepID=A0A8K0TBB9_9PEZI|nr:hypothetical protein B0T11DRAFT_126859 [Plectosphaerella cucumerina]
MYRCSTHLSLPAVFLCPQTCLSSCCIRTRLHIPCPIRGPRLSLLSMGIFDLTSAPVGVGSPLTCKEVSVTSQSPDSEVFSPLTSPATILHLHRAPSSKLPD